MTLPGLGQLLDDERKRDAVHVAIAPVTANEALQPGQHVGLVEPGNVDLIGRSDRPLGIVDPYLTEEVQAGQRCWMLLYPDSITDLRHVWTHPAFTVAARRIRGEHERANES